MDGWNMCVFGRVVQGVGWNVTSFGAGGGRLGYSCCCLVILSYVSVAVMDRIMFTCLPSDSYVACRIRLLKLAFDDSTSHISSITPVTTLVSSPRTSAQVIPLFKSSSS